MPYGGQMVGEPSFQFPEAIEALASYLADETQSAEDFIIGYGPSYVTEQKVYTSITLGQPEIALQLRATLEQQIEQENDAYLKNHVSLYWAQSLLQLNEVEESIRYINQFFAWATVRRSPHEISKVYTHLRQLEKAGHKDLPVVKEFQEELETYAQQLDAALKIATVEDKNHR